MMKAYPLCMMLGLVALMAYSPAGAQATGDTGIYLTIKCSKNIPRQAVMLTGRSVCLPSSPIILPADLESVGDVTTAGNVVYFELTFRPKARDRLAALTANLPGTNLALVVNGEVFFVFKAEDLKVLRTFRFQSSIDNLSAFNRVNASLKELVVPN